MTEKTAPFIISRTFDAPLDLMWKMWSTPEQMAKWWGPKGVTVAQSKMDFRNGGSYHYCMLTPDGKEMWGRFDYIDIQPKHKIEFLNGFSDKDGGQTRHPMNPTWPLTLLSTIRFAEKDGKTAVTIEWVPVEASDIERKTFEDGRESMKMGWGGTLECLAEYIACDADNQKRSA